MHSPRVSKGDADKRTRLKSSNPRKEKCGGGKAKQPGKKKMLEKIIDWIMHYHLKFHHLKDSRVRCDSSKCPFQHKTYENSGKIPLVLLKK